MKPFGDAFFKFGPTIKTTFIAGDGQRVEARYSFEAGPEAAVTPAKDVEGEHSAWDVDFAEPAMIPLGRGVYYFRKASVFKRDEGYEMFITLLFRNDLGGERLVYTVKEL
ncbi:hypothetical protein [Klebsiella aerogenes]|uniref:hypothetical protein n=1 Tax=Klebsiella aerogenes TaxID=548 RepID=UPI001BCD6D6B|nr:hypothetical protein [Klebsiella aerogenes]EKZ5443009.1 hypothetical protein [Klebsiella aerogenes]